MNDTKDLKIKNLIDYLMKNEPTEEEFSEYCKENGISMVDILKAAAIVGKAQQEFEEELKEETAQDILER